MTGSQAVASRTPRAVLDRYHRAMLDKSADDLADLYAVDAVHEFPFSAPGFPAHYAGREAVRGGYRAAWGASPFQVVEIRDVVVHVSDDPGTVIAGHVVVVRSAGGGRAAVPGLLIIDVSDGLITRVRDYMDALAVARAAGVAGA
ncbi:nuclear transport factor 2 family protein [Streptomyces sp. NBC_01022]|uniref:nuclear transport factor 2 family protein n=1 Tax=Streptomyces sp. NBC_01022 TaxID=2903723 RepID=UPI002DD86FFC|nr:nuclear transport factor 2 family protein [Streptomyces sp. NBC_01022]WRZ80507.1 nuclear transport factor 2 family protein [Streptomyces sp. NBC_01022]